MKKLLYIIIIISFTQQKVFSQVPKEINGLLQKLDSVLSNKSEYLNDKEVKIKELRKKQNSTLKLEEKLWLNKMFYDEFSVYNADSAMTYVDMNINISKELGRTDLYQEWVLEKVFILSATGVLREAEQILNEINTEYLSDDLKFKYYNSKIYLYSHFGQYIGSHPDLANIYYEREAELKREAKKYINPESNYYYGFMGSLYESDFQNDERLVIKSKLRSIVESSNLSSRTDAINAYVLSRMYYREGDDFNYMRYLIYSAIADVKICNRDIASIEELSELLYKYHDIDRGYTYINYCLNNALLYPNRVRMVNISSLMDKLHKAYQERNIRQESRLRTFLYVVSILLIILILSVSFIYVQFIKLKKSRRKLKESNRLLNINVEELSKAKDMLADVNIKLNDANNKLSESNYVKEEYIGYVFSICSSYISKLEEYRKNISRKLKAGHIDDVRMITSNTTIVHSELKKFYNSFDAIFLNVYPDFVDDFNSLLREEERIILKEGELLNTELRIYALVRLGINDSVKISEFLHCSPQTVYNNRFKTRNKAMIPKDEFDERVRFLGKIQK